MSLRPPHPGDAREGGFSIVEVLVAALILMVAAGAIATLASSASHNTFRAEQDQVVVNRLQNEMERIRQLPFNQVALTSKPVLSNDLADPAARVSADGTLFDLNRNGTNTKPLALASGTTPEGHPVGCGATGLPVCGVNPGPEPFRSGDVSGKIYRYVVYPGVPPDCTGCSPDYFKRIVVAIRLDTTPAGGAHTYQEIQTNLSSPDAVPSNNPVPPCDTNTDCPAQQVATFWLTDTPCNNTSRIAPTSNHATHDTRGRCSDTSSGPPDLMSTDPISGDASEATYDYSTDVQRNDTPSTYGLALLRTQLTPGCALQQAQALAGSPTNQLMQLPSPEPNPQLEMHTWVTDPLTTTFSTLTSAKASLDLWAKSVGGAAYQGGLCVYVFKRFTIQQQIGGITTANFVVDWPASIGLAKPYVEIQRATWPQDWTKVSTGTINLTMLSADQILSMLQSVPGTLTVTQSRLGLGLTVDQQHTSGGALEAMYDHPTYDSHLEVDTPTGACIIGACP